MCKQGNSWRHEGGREGRRTTNDDFNCFRNETTCRRFWRLRATFHCYQQLLTLYLHNCAIRSKIFSLEGMRTSLASGMQQQRRKLFSQFDIFSRCLAVFVRMCLWRNTTNSWMNRTENVRECRAPCCDSNVKWRAKFDKDFIRLSDWKSCKNRFMGFEVSIIVQRTPRAQIICEHSSATAKTSSLR